MLNGITPVSNIGSSTTSSAVSTDTSQGSDNPLDGISYTEKVQQQKQQTDFHGFPDVVDNYGGYGNQQIITGNDGNVYTQLQIPGSYKGYDGNFVYIWNENGVCNHRVFERVN